MELSGGRQQSGLAAGGMKRGWRGVSATSDAAQNSKRPAMVNRLPFLGQEKWEASICQEDRFTM